MKISSQSYSQESRLSNRAQTLQKMRILCMEINYRNRFLKVKTGCSSTLVTKRYCANIACIGYVLIFGCLRFSNIVSLQHWQKYFVILFPIFPILIQYFWNAGFSLIIFSKHLNTFETNTFELFPINAILMQYWISLCSI